MTFFKLKQKVKSLVPSFNGSTSNFEIFYDELTSKYYVLPRQENELAEQVITTNLSENGLIEPLFEDYSQAKAFLFLCENEHTNMIFKEAYEELASIIQKKMEEFASAIHAIFNQQ